MQISWTVFSSESNLFRRPVVDMIMTSKYYLDTGKGLKYQNDLFSLSVLGLCYSSIWKCMWPLQGEIYIFNICWIPAVCCCCCFLSPSCLFLSLTQLIRERWVLNILWPYLFRKHKKGPHVSWLQFLSRYLCPLVIMIIYLIFVTQEIRNNISQYVGSFFLIF